MDKISKKMCIILSIYVLILMIPMLFVVESEYFMLYFCIDFALIIISILLSPKILKYIK